jgi:hypothetical protein
MRAISAGLVLLATSACLSLACANRGMHAPTGAGTAGTSGATGAAGTSGGMGGSGAGGGAGTSGGGAGGTGGVTGTGGACTIPSASDAAVDAAACTAKFNFESGLQGANIPSSGQGAFTNVVASGAYTYCGNGALAVTASFSGTGGPTTKGIVEIPIAPADMDFTGKTLTVHVAADPGCVADLGIAVVLLTGSGSPTVVPTTRGITSDWKTLTAVIDADGGVLGESSVLTLSLQAFSQSGYQGTIYIDEIAITGP